MVESRRVLFTGGAGFIGSALSRAAASSSARWVAVDAMHPQVHPTRARPDALDPGAELVVADVVDDAWWEDLIDDLRPDTVIHLAAETGTAQSLDEASRHALVNVAGTTRLTDALGRVGVLPERVVLASSRAVYGEGRWRRASGEVFSPGQRAHAQLAAGRWDFPDAVPLPSSAATTVPSPTSVYGATKLAQEHILTAWGGSHDVPVTVYRFQNVYGPGQSLTNPYTGIVSLFSQLAMRGETIPVYEDGGIVRDFVFISDVVEALIAGIRRPEPWAGPALDIGSGVGTSILRLAEIVADFHGAPPPRVTGAYRDGDIRHAECSIDASRIALEWSPDISVETGVAELQEWIADQSTVGTGR